MNSNSRTAVLSAVLLLGMLLSGAFPKSAMADDVPPPPPDATEPAPLEQPAEAPPAEAPPTEAPPTEAPPTEAAPTEAPPTEAAPTEVAPTSTEVETQPSDVIGALPPETGLVVLDANGQPMSLTSTEAALAIATGDPMWCPAGLLPGDIHCSGPFSAFNGAGGLLDQLQTNLTLCNGAQCSGAGTIYVSYLYNAAGEGGPIIIDGLGGYGITDLTVQGGWEFGIPNKVVGTTTFSEALQIINWSHDVTLNDLIFDNTGESENLLVETTGNIELNNVESKNNSGGKGAKLDNTAGSGSIEANSSSFHDNLTIGIQALSNNGISLTDVDAYDNLGSGAVLDNCQAAVTCAATFAGSVYVSYSTFNDNAGDGLNVASNGYVQTIDVQANDNGLSGAVLDNSKANSAQSATVGYLYGSEFNDNFDNGLTVLSKGDITVYQATANGNGHTSDYAGAGAYLDNTYGDADTYIYNYNIYTHQYGEFNDNYADGLDVLSNGNVELWYIRAEGNGTASPAWGMGTYIDNCNWDGSNCDGTGWVEVNHSDLNGNYSAGLWVYSGGDIDLTDVTANDNGSDATWGVGAHLDNSDGSGGVTIDGGEFGSYVTGGNYGDGLQVYSSGDIYLDYVVADNNGQGGDLTAGNGAILDSCLENAGACAGTGYVYVFASEFSGNYTNGLSAFSSNNIWMNYYVSADDNGRSLSLGSGAILVNNFNGATGSILLYGPITLNSNFNNGLIAQSNSDIYMTGLDTGDNGDAGASATTTNGSVTIDSSTFNSNDDYGLMVNAPAGDVTASSVEASDNGTYGASIFSGGAVSINVGAFDSNLTGSGLDIDAVGNVDLSGVSANDNFTHGASITNGGDTRIDNSTFDLNKWDYGLSVSSAGDVVLDTVSASDNWTDGATIGNGGNITINTGTFDANRFGYGLNVASSGDVALSDVSASDNWSYGADISNGGNTTISMGFFDGNKLAYGLDISSVGDVDLSSVSASDNGTYGADISNGGNTAISSGTFDSNTSDYGLHISSSGDVALDDVSASHNDTYGAFVGNGGNTTITAAYFDWNGTDQGVDISSGGDVTLMDVSASYNGTHGADISNGGSVSIDPSYFNLNGTYGLQVHAQDGILLDSVQASDNIAGFGADLLSTVGGIGIGSSAFDGNGGYGLNGGAPGNISVSNTTASDNSGLGANLATNGSLSLLGSTFSQNTGGMGLTLAAVGNTSLQGVTADDNSSIGASIASLGPVNVDASAFNSNSAVGLNIASNGDVGLSGVGADGNTLAGASIASSSNVFVDPSSFTGNGSEGLSISAGGTALLAGVYAANNTGVGAKVDANGGITINGGFFGNNGGDGLNLGSGANILIKCATAVANGGYGVDATLPGVLTTKGIIVGGNTSGDVKVTGGTWLDVERACEGWPHWDTSGLPWQVFHVNSGDSHALECTQHGGTVLILPDWDHVAIPCPITGDASLSAVSTDNLPGALGDNYQFVSGMDAQIKPAPDGDIRVDFLIPPAYLGTHLIILHWDGSQWVDRGGVQTNDNFFEITAREGGVYVLVSQ